MGYWAMGVMTEQSQDARRHDGNRQHHVDAAALHVDKTIDRRHANNIPADSVSAEQMKQFDEETKP